MSKRTPKPGPVSFTVELLPKDKETALERLGPYDAHSLESFARAYREEYGEFFQLEGFVFVSSDLDNIFNFKGNDLGLKEFAEWASHNSLARFGYDKPGLNRHELINWVKLPSGVWFVQVPGHGSWMTIDTAKGGYDYRPKLWQSPNKWSPGNFRWAVWSGAGDAEAGHWGKYEELHKDFSAAWKAARDKHRKHLRETGEAREIFQEAANKDFAERTDIRMKAAAQAAKIRDILEVYIKSLNNETMTVKEIGEVYHELIALTEHNKTMKNIYGKKMPKE